MKNVPMKFALQHQLCRAAYREGMNVDTNVDRCNRMRRRSKISLSNMYVCIDTRARSKSCSNEAKFYFNVQNIIQIYF